jgi:hypothetical protein
MLPALSGGKVKTPVGVALTDIRLLRSREPGISEQMLDLSPYREPEEHHGRDWSPGMSDAHIMRALASTIRYKNPQNS